MRRFSIFVLSLVCAAALAASPTRAATSASVTVLWDADTIALDLAGYRVYRSTDSALFSLTPAEARTYATTVDVDKLTTSSVLSGLDPAIVYWIAVTALDDSANESAFSTVVSAQPSDTIFPAIALTTPSSGSTLTGVVTVAADSTDDVGVAGVQFLLDGIDLGVEDTATPYAIAWDTTVVAGTTHVLTARARDAAGNTTLSASIPVTTQGASTGTKSPSHGPRPKYKPSL